MSIPFPPDPQNGIIVEVDPGIYYQYDKSSKSWIRLQGFNQFINVATPYDDGLMSKEDYIKLNGLLNPPPNTSITSDDCDFTFRQGFYGFRSIDEDIIIEVELDLYGQNDVYTKSVFKIHENTYGINFRTNIEKLVYELNRRGLIKQEKIPGPQGKQGKRGPKGINNLDTGPVGKTGPSGNNAAWPFDLVEDTSAKLTAPGRGIVDVTTEEISPDENYLVITKGNVGNFQYCPEKLKPSNVRSPWLLVVDERPETIKVLKECGTTTVGRCNNELCGADTKPIRYCTTKLYYVDMTYIEDQVKERFEELLAEMKAAKEKIVNDWLNTMIKIFEEVKKSVCCATQNAISKQANRAMRERIEELRIQAAQADLKLVLGFARDAAYNFNICKGNKTVPVEEPPIRPKVCPVSVNGCDYPPMRPPGGHPLKSFMSNISRAIDSCADVETFVLDCKNNIGEPTGVYKDVPSGDYYINISICCNYDTLYKVYNMPLAVVYSQDGSNKTLYTSDDSGFSDLNDANNAYCGLSLKFRHDGGPMAMYINSSNGSGIVTATLKDATCVEQSIACATAPVFPTGDPGAPDQITCDVDAQTVQWYEAGWRSGACCGVWLTAGGQQWIIVKRSLENDTTCGGGASPNEPCYIAAMDKTQTHPAYAFPTLDGNEFIGKPTSVQTMVRDMDLETEIMSKLYDDQYQKIVGDPKSNLESILFPSNLV